MAVDISSSAVHSAVVGGIASVSAVLRCRLPVRGRRVLSMHVWIVSLSMAAG